VFESDVKFYSFSFAAHIFPSRHSSFPWVLHKQLFFTTAFLIHALVVVRCYCVSGFLFICSLYRSFDCPKLYCILVPAVTCRVVTRLMSCALWSLRMQNVHALLCINSEHTALMTRSLTPRSLRSNSQGSLSVCLLPRTIADCCLPSSSS